MVSQTGDFVGANNDLKEKLGKLLTAMFQFDVSDLDFGIYKVLSYKKKEISEFINKDLIEEIGKQLSLLGAEEQKRQQEELDNVRKQLINLGVEGYENNPKYQEKKKQLEDIKASEELEKEIYNRIYTFFSRYYDKGDFLSKRRYGANEKYAIPYNGEEVLLYWANNDQYYVKTTESFRNFSFRIPGLTIHFRVKEAEEENGNVRSEEDRYFVVSSEKVYGWEDDNLSIFFEYRGLTDKEKEKYPRPNQDQINEDMLGTIRKALAKEDRAEGLFSEEEDGNTSIRKNLYKYTRKNTSDYFIHKDLRGFLQRELDFYIKNEVVDLSDVAQLDAEHFSSYVLEVKVLKSICFKIIDFLAQIENFQKKLWEKKKFVLRTDYCITLDYVDEKYYPEILKNKAQWEEWKKLYGFEMKEAIKKLSGTLKGHYGSNNEIEVLKQNPTLMIDTKFFDDEFKFKLLEAVEISDEKINGILINSENYQALNLLSRKYGSRIKACYIDPPYNTDATPILYKNGYQDSTWLSLMNDRLALGKSLLTEKGVMCVTIDDKELSNLKLLMQKIFIEDEIITVVIEYNKRGRIQGNFTPTHEYALWAVKKSEDLITRLPDVAEDIRRNFRRTGNNSRRADRPTMFYGIEVDKKSLKILSTTEPLPLGKPVPAHKNPDTEMIWPIDSEGYEKNWYYGRKSVLEGAKLGEIWAKRISGPIQIHYHIPGKPIRRKTVWQGKELDASTHGTEVLNDLFGRSPFPFPKSVFAVRQCIESMTYDPNITVLDYFAGSGTTAHAVIRMNKDDKGNRKYILIEMGQYFDSITKPRVQKVLYSDNWKSGKPLDNNGTRRHIIKYHYLEQYEDALENIEFSQKKLSEFSDYFVKYMLDFETRGSKTFLKVDAVEEPFSYKINVIEDYERREVNVDLVETYNYLIGLEVERLQTFQNKGDKNRRYVTIIGKRDAKPTIVIWRVTKELDPETDRNFIQKNILKEQYEEIHINGDSLIKDAVLIEEQLKHLMNRS